MENVEASELLTMEEMRKRYDGEWVLIVDFEADPVSNEVIRGRVLAHDVDMRAVERADEVHQPARAAYYCFGEPGAGTILIL